MKKKIIIALAIISLVALFKVFNVEDYLTLSYIKDSQVKFETLYAENRAAVIAGFMLMYIVVTSLSLPGASAISPLRRHLTKSNSYCPA